MRRTGPNRVRVRSGLLALGLTAFLSRHLALLNVRPFRSFPARFAIFFDPQSPRRMYGPGPNIFFYASQPNVGHAHPSPATRNRKKNVRKFLDERCLLLGRQHKIAIVLLG